MRAWWFSVGVLWEEECNVINDKKFYPCKDGVLIIHPDGKTVQYIRNSFYDFVN